MGKEDLEKGKETPNEDTSELVSSETKFDQDGNEIKEEPTKKEVLPKEDDKGSPPEPSDGKKYKYSSMDEYDKAYHEAERKMHEATTKASTLEKELERHRKPPEKVPTEDEQIAEITDAALKDIRAIPVEYGSDGRPTKASAEDYDRKSAIIWGKANAKITRLEIEKDRKVSEEGKSLSRKLYDKAKSEGFNMADEDDLAEIAFQWDKATGDTPDDRISNAVRNAKERLERLRGKFSDAIERDKKEKDSLRVLGGGSRNRPTEGGKEKKDSKPSDMYSALEEVKNKRRVKKDDLLG
jgi:hypothetical protein